MVISCLTVLAPLWLGAVEAPVAAVTVYSDRARVVRTASVTLAGAQRVELPPLPALVDPSSIRVEAQGAEVRAVDIARVEPNELPIEQGRRLLAELETIEDRIAQTSAEREAYVVQLDGLGVVTPKAPPVEGQRPPPKLEPSGWSQADAFLADLRARLQGKSREAAERLKELEREHAHLQHEAQLLGGADRRGGWHVTVLASGKGAATLQLTYVIARARWIPTYDIRLFPKTNEVQLSFSGLVSQETGEDWNGAKLTLSTAVPASTTAFPKLLTWKLGAKERFIPAPAPLTEAMRPPPAAPPLPETTRDAEALRRRLLEKSVATKEGKQEEDEKDKAKVTVAKEPEAKQLTTDFIRSVPVTTPGARSYESLAETAPGSLSTRPNASGSGTITGTITDAATKSSLMDVVVTATALQLSGEQVVVSDGSGSYWIPQLPQGEYTLRFDKDGYKPYSRSGVQLRSGATLRINAELLPESLKAEEIVVVGRAPTVDVGSSMTGTTISLESTAPSSMADSYGGRSSAPTVVAGSLAPPPGYVRPRYAPELPASLAGGNDLSYAAPRPETLRSGGGARRVALFSETWPVSVERRIYPALATHAFMVAELKSPSAQALPGGLANLAVGDDPAGTARLGLVSPGEPFTLPLGIDRAIKPVRNVQLVQAEKGLIGKSDVGEYVVTDEIANPYPFPLRTRIYDQWPLPGTDDVEIKLVRVEPWAIQDKVKGSLEWHQTLPPGGKVTVTFTYSLRRPKGWQLYQWQ